MATGFGVYYIQKLLNLQFGGTAYTFIGVDLALCTTSGSATALGTEVSGGSYARLSVPASTTTFPTISGSTTTINNNVTLSFVQSTGSWGTVTTVFVVEHALSNIIYFGDLVASQTVGTNNVFQFLANNFSVQLT
jgi:hypothetical protein